MAYENICPAIYGFIEVPNISDANTMPIPIPGPINAMVLIPAPMYLAYSNIMKVIKRMFNYD